MRMKRLQGLLLAAVLICGAVAVLFPVFRIDPHELTAPLTIGYAQAWADGGSMQIEVHGANGKRLGIERVGSLDIERSQQKMYLTHAIFGLVLWRRTVDKGSALETESHEMLEAWLKDRLSSKQRELLQRGDPQAFQDIPGEVVLVYDMAFWIATRNRPISNASMESIERRSVNQ